MQRVSFTYFSLLFSHIFQFFSPLLSFFITIFPCRHFFYFTPNHQCLLGFNVPSRPVLALTTVYLPTELGYRDCLNSPCIYAAIAIPCTYLISGHHPLCIYFIKILQLIRCCYLLFLCVCVCVCV